MRDRALFDLAIDSKLRGCDLVKLKIGTLVTGHDIRARAMVIQQKTGRPVQFEITTDARASLLAWLERRGGSVEDFAFPSRADPDDHLGTRQYARLVDEWVTAIGLRKEEYGTHSLRRTRPRSSARQQATSAPCNPSWPYQDREHGSASGRRCGGRTRTGGAHRSLTISGPTVGEAAREDADGPISYFERRNRTVSNPLIASLPNPDHRRCAPFLPFRPPLLPPET